MFAGGSTYSGLAAAGGAGANNTSGNAGSHASGPSGSASSAASSSFPNAMAEANDLDALVFEFGTSKCKLGFAGEDAPRVYESPVEFESTAPYDRRRAACMESDYEAVAQWLFDAAGSRLQTRLSDHPLLLVERPFAIPDEFLRDVSTSNDSDKKEETTESSATGKKRDGKARERLVEVLMESVDLPALFCAKSAVLACYANARTSGLVVEMGATYTSVTSVHDGYAFAYPKSQMRRFGGDDVDAFLHAKLAPQLSGRTTGASFSSPSRLYWSLATETKESGLCRVADGPFDEAANAQLPKIGYELPDKTIVQLGTERFSVGEQYFTVPTTSPNELPFEKTEIALQYGVQRGLALPEFVCETGGMTTEAELRKELFQNIVLTGGSSCFENLPTRLEREVIVALTNSGTGIGPGTGSVGFGSTRVKLVAAHAQERRLGSFLGGSILASLGSFHEMWLSKAEYAEHGAALIHKKCP